MSRLALVSLVFVVGCAAQRSGGVGAAERNVASSAPPSGAEMPHLEASQRVFPLRVGVVGERERHFRGRLTPTFEDPGPTPEEQEILARGRAARDEPTDLLAFYVPAGPAYSRGAGGTVAGVHGRGAVFASVAAAPEFVSVFGLGGVSIGVYVVPPRVAGVGYSPRGPVALGPFDGGAQVGVGGVNRTAGRHDRVNE